MKCKKIITPFLSEMNKDEHRLYFSSKYHIYGINQAIFTVNLPFPLLLSGKWKCALLDVYIKFKEAELESCYILGDFCETSLIDSVNQLSILKKLYLEPNESYYSFALPLYIPVKQTQLNNLSLSLLDSNLEHIYQDKITLVECTVHFYKDE